MARYKKILTREQIFTILQLGGNSKYESNIRKRKYRKFNL